MISRDLINALILAIGSYSVGIIVGYPSPVTPAVSDEFGLSESLSTLFSTLGPLMSIAGGLIIGPLVKHFGRKMTILSQAAVQLIGFILLAITKKPFWQLAFVGRALTGLTMGSLCGACSMYISEIAPDGQKDAYGVLHQFLINIGLDITYLLAIWCKWRVLTWVSAIPSVLLSALIWFVPTSPAEIEHSETTQESIFQKKYIYPLVVSFLFVFFQQFSGVNGILSNLKAIFVSTGINLNEDVCSFIVGIANVIATGVASPVLQKITPKHGWTISAGIQFVCLMLIWVNGMWNLTPYLPLIALFFDTFGFGFAFGPVPWYYIPLLVPETVRGSLQSLSTAVNWGCAAIVVYTWPYIEKSFGEWSYFFFGAICFLAMLFGIFIVKPSQDENGEEPV